MELTNATADGKLMAPERFAPAVDYYEIRNIARNSAKAAMERARAKEKWHSIVPKRPDQIDWSYLREQVGHRPSPEEKRVFADAYRERIEEESPVREAPAKAVKKE